MDEDDTPTMEIGLRASDAVQAGARLYLCLACGASLREILGVLADLTGIDRDTYYDAVERVVERDVLMAEEIED